MSTRSFPAPMLRDRPRVNSIYRAAAVMLRSHYQQLSYEEATRSLYGRDSGLEPILKAASNPATLTDPQWAGSATQSMIRDLTQAITGLSAAASLMEAGTKIDLSGYASIRIPGRLYDPSMGGSWVAEGAAIPMRIPLLTQGPTLEPRKLGVIASFTREMVESSAIEAFTRMAISEGAAATLDLAMFSTNPGDATVPPGILAGATTVNPAPATPGGWIISSDIGALIEALAQNGGGLDPVIIAAPAQAAALRMWRQEDFYAVYPTLALPAATVVAVEASSFVSAVDALPNFSVTTGAILHEEDTTPTDIVSAGGAVAAPVRSFFQTDTIGLKMVMRASWGLRNPAHVSIVSGVSW